MQDIINEGLDKKIMLAGISDDWLKIINNKELDKVIEGLKEYFVIRETSPKIKMCPKLKDIFSFAKKTKLSDIKVLIIGQDAYPSKSAHGLAFSSKIDVPPSLLNIFKCLLKSKLINEIPKKGNLTRWAEQGVLLLNTSLTTTMKCPLEHINIWKNYTETLIKVICKKIFDQEKPLVVMLWGNYAKSYEKVVLEGHPKACVMKWRHASPMAQQCKEELRFINCNHFVKCNEILEENKLDKIKW
jgi:uracil-DNA glycosylase